jgi:hypothetical protein
VYSDEVYLPNGRHGYAVHCDGTDHDMNDCRNHADKICAGPYSIEAQVGPPGDAPKGRDHRLMIIECGSPAAPK